MPATIASCTTVMMEVKEQSQVGAARRQAMESALELGFSEERCNDVAIVASELSTNLIKHTEHGGAILINRCTSGGDAELELISIDKGSGMGEIDAALRDGYSTAGTLGNGLGAIKRLSRAFDLYSNSDHGTVVAARLSIDAGRKDPKWPVFAGIAVPLAGEPVSGDTWAIQSNGEGILVTVADGLGHGLEAADASRAAVHTITSQNSNSPRALLSQAHDALRGTRGAAASIAFIKPEVGMATFAGLGNVSAMACNSQRRTQFSSLDGTLGFEARKIKQYEYELEDLGVLIMSSDGCSNRWNITQYPGLLTHSATVIFATIWRDSVRRRDDSTMVAVKLS